MDKKTKSAMDEILDKYNNAQKQAEQKQAVADSKEKTFLDSFKDKITDTIRPCLEEFSLVLKEEGHECRVASTDSSEDINTTKKAKEAKIDMALFPNGIDFSRSRSSEDIPKISFHAIPYEQKVVTHISTVMPGRGGTSGSGGGKFSIDEITTETIKQEVLTFLGKVFQNASLPYYPLDFCQSSHILRPSEPYRVKMNMLHSKSIFLAGVPATGKTYFGKWLETNRDYLHLDIEDNKSVRSHNLRSEVDQFLTKGDYDPLLVKLNATDKPIILNYGFPPECLSIIKNLLPYGLRPVWFRANKKIAREKFLDRGGIDIRCFDTQMSKIENNYAALNKVFRECKIATLLDNGCRLNSQDIFKCINKKLWLVSVSDVSEAFRSVVI